RSPGRRRSNSRRSARGDCRPRQNRSETCCFTTHRHDKFVATNFGTRELAGSLLMNRFGVLREGITKDQIGVEIGPYWNPLVPKREGFGALALDLFDAETLRQLAEQDPGIPRELISNIEDVDIIGSATDLDELVAACGLTGQLDYVVSSHNFEHLP